MPFLSFKVFTILFHCSRFHLRHTHTLPPVYTWRLGLLIVTAQTTSPWLRTHSWRACRGIPGPTRASAGNGTGCIWPSALTWNEYALEQRDSFVILTRSSKRDEWFHGDWWNSFAAGTLLRPNPWSLPYPTLISFWLVNVPCIHACMGQTVFQKDHCYP